MSDLFRGAQPPQRLSNPSIRLLVAKPGQRFLVRLLGSVEVCYLHWDGSRAVPCQGEPCAKCPPGPRRWMGYAPGVAEMLSAAEGRNNWVKRVIPITLSAAYDLTNLDPEQALFYFRETGKATAALRFAHSKVQPSGNPPEGFDPRPYVARVWGVPWPAEQAPVSQPADDQVLTFDPSVRPNGRNKRHA